MFSLDRWRGKVAVVTGASAGIGAAICEALVQHGLKVVGMARRLNRMEELAIKLTLADGVLYPIKCDVTKEEDILQAFQWVGENLGPVHILINNAGILYNGSLFDGKTEIWKQILDVNVLGLCIATREALKMMTEHEIDGHIIHINSIAGSAVPNIPNLNVYPATKHAVTALTESLRREINSLGKKIRVTSVCPGVVQTEIFDVGHVPVSDGTPQLESEDIAAAVVYVLSTPPHVQVHQLIVRPVGELI